MPVYTPEQIATAIKAFQPPPTQDPQQAEQEQEAATRPFEDPFNQQRRFTEETDDPLGAAGERGVSTPAPEPAPIGPVDPQQARIAKAIENFRQQEAGNWFKNAQKFGATFSKAALGGALDILGSPFQAASGLLGSFEAPSLAGKSVDEVKAIRDQMVQQKAAIDKSMDSIMGTGQVSVDDGTGTISALAIQSANLDRQIQNADGIIASGQAQFTEAQHTPITGALSWAANQPEAIKKAVEQAFPTDADFANSWGGRIATIGGGVVPLVGAALVGDEPGAALGLLGMVGGQAYADAKAHGANDQTASNAGLMQDAMTAATLPFLGTTVAGLARNFAGLTTKEGINAIMSAVSHMGGAGVEMGVFQLQSNAVAKLSGYDPNRPMDQGFWGSFWTGTLFGAFSHFTSASPRLDRLNQPDVTVRNKPGTPPDTGGTTKPETPPPGGNVPQGTPGGAPPTVTDPAQEATQAVQQNAGAPPEQVLANAGTPEQQLQHTIDTLAPLQQAQPAAQPTEVSPGVTSEQEAAEAQLGKPLSNVDQLAQAHAEIAQEMEQLMRKGSAPLLLGPRTADVVTKQVSELQPAESFWAVTHGAQEHEPAATTAAPVAEAAAATTAPTAPATPETAAAPPAPQGTLLTKQSPQWRIAVGTLTKAGLSKEEAISLIDKTPTTVKGGRGLDVAQKIIQARQLAEPPPTTSATAATEPFEVPQLSANPTRDELARVTAWNQLYPGQKQAILNGDQGMLDRFNWEVENIRQHGRDQWGRPIGTGGAATQETAAPSMPAAKTPRRIAPKATAPAEAPTAPGTAPAKAPAAKPIPDAGKFEVPRQGAKSQVRTPEQRARWEVWDSLSTKEQRALRSNDAAAIEKFNRNVAEQLQANEANKSWYETNEFASRRGTARPPVRETPIDQAGVKAEVNDAQLKMGMDDHLHYVPSVEALPERVKNGLTTGERNSTAQIVRDNKLGDVYVIGDRFSGTQELRRAIIEETLPYSQRKVSDVRTIHDPADSRLAYYDMQSDRPVLNTDALLRTEDPYTHASKSLLEEIDVHQAFAKFLGPRNGKTYVDAMNGVQRNFDRLKLNDILAQRKGYANLAEMAKDYGLSDYESNPRSQHALTEELIGAYAQGFGTRAELAANAPAWYQTALRSLNNAIRSRLGLKLDDIDVQHLIADSASALRYPKYQQEGMFHPEIAAQAKADMSRYQLANRRPDEEWGAGAGETADVGTQMVKAKIRSTEAGLGDDEIMRQQGIRLAFDKSRSFSERMGLLNEASLVTNRQHDAEVMKMAQDMFDRDAGGNVSLAMDMLRDFEKTGAVNTGLTEIVTRKAQEQINDMKAAGYGEQAKLAEAKLDRFNQDVLAHSSELARELGAMARLRNATGNSIAAGYKQRRNEVQAGFTNKKRNAQETAKIKKGMTEVQAVSEKAAGELATEVKKPLKSLQERIAANAKSLAEREVKPGEKRPQGTTKSLPEQYTEDLVKRIRDALTKIGGVKEMAPLEDVFNTFRKNIQAVVREQVDIPKPPPTEKPTAMDTLRQVMTNYPAYEQAWRRTVDELQTANPELFAKLNRAVAEPVGRDLANKLAREHGVDLGDLIYNHYSNVNRVTGDLANQIAEATGLSGADAQRLADKLQQRFTDIVKTKQASRLQQILDAVGNTKNNRPGKGELAQLIDHVAIGSLDNKEWLNTVAPRFGMISYTPEDVARLKQVGDNMMQIRDAGLSSSVVAQRIRREIGDIVTPAEGRVAGAFRYLRDTYIAGLLTGPLTHLPYWFHNFFIGGFNSLIKGINVINQTGDTALAGQMWGDYWKGIGRGLQEFKPILQEGFAPTEMPSWESREGERMIRSNALEKMQVTANPLTWGGQYRYVRNILEAVSNVLSRGTEYAMLRANYTELAYKGGLSGAEAWKYAEEGVYGSKAQQDLAHDEAQDYAQRFNLTKNATTMLENELLDKYKTKTAADDPDTTWADDTRIEREDIARRSLTSGVRSTMRGDVYGFAGSLSRALIKIGQENQLVRLVVPFMKVPFNLINELAAWTPLGIVRGFNTEMAEHFVGQGPGMKARLESQPGTPGHFSEAQLEQLRMEQLVKGIAGSTVAGALGAYIQSNLNNPDPPIRFSYTGPGSYGQQQIEQGKGWQPHAVKIGDHWFNYENTPFRAMFSALGAYEDYKRYGKPNDDPVSSTVLGAAHALHGAISSTLGSPLQGLRAAFDYTNREAGMSAGAVERDLSNFLTQVVAAVPTTLVGGTFTRQVYRAIHPTEYEAPSTDYLSKLYRNIPVVNSIAAHMGVLQPKLNVLGEHLDRNPLNNFPIIPTNVPDDPVWQFLAHHDNIKLSMPGNQGKVDDVKMTPEEVYVHHQARGPALKANLAQAIREPGFLNAKLDDQNSQVKDLESEAKEVGDEAVRDYRNKHPNPREEEPE